MSEMRAVGNLCGNSVAALIVAIWDKQIDWEKFRYAMDNPEKFTMLVCINAPFARSHND